MATTDIQAEAGTETAQDRWQRMWSHREQLLKVARRRSMSLEDAEDAVHEAMLRAAERPDLDDERLAAWLTTVTMRLCVDRHRQVSREAEVHRSPTLLAPGPVPVEEAVCDRAEAHWLAVRSGELPARQAEALRLKSEDLDVGQVAVRMGLSYRTVESLLARARRHLRGLLAGTLGVLLFLCGRGRPRAGAVTASTTAATLVVAGFALLPHTDAWDRQDSSPPPVSFTPAPSEPARERPYGESAGTPPTEPRAPRRAEAAEERPAPSAEDRELLPLSVPALPALPTDEVTDEVTDDVTGAVPDVPEVPAVPPVPDLPSPGLPSASALPDLPEAPLPAPEVTAPTLPENPAEKIPLP